MHRDGKRVHAREHRRYLNNTTNTHFSSRMSLIDGCHLEGIDAPSHGFWIYACIK